MEETVDSRNTVILVVGNLQEKKTAVVDCLTKVGNWETYTTLAGVRILTHTSGAQVVDTLDVRNVQGKSPTIIARRWISQNSLNRVILGKRVVVVCVITNAIVKEKCNACVSSWNCWLGVLGTIWENHKDILTVAVTESSNDLSLESQEQLEMCLRGHGIRSRSFLVSNLSSEASVGKLVESIRKMCPTFCPSNEQTTFERGDSSNASWCGIGGRSGSDCRQERVLGRIRFVPWSPERLILFGRTGSGKSTLAQMLTLGKLDEQSTKFKASSGIRGETDAISSGEGRGWYVVDTPGLGEPESEASTVPTHFAQLKVKKCVEAVEGTFSHYLFVLKKDRIDSFDVSLWKFFKQLFTVCGGKTSHHWSIVISDADQTWLRENNSYLRQTFEGCSSFLTAEFPSIDDDEETETVYEEMRAESLRGLEEGLASLGRFDLSCDFGEMSRMSILNERDRSLNDEKVDQTFAALADLIESFGYLGVNPCVSGVGLGSLLFFTSIDKMIHHLTRIMSKDHITLDIA